jgi:hypothetical protein
MVIEDRLPLPLHVVAAVDELPGDKVIPLCSLMNWVTAPEMLVSQQMTRVAYLEILNLVLVCKPSP